MVLASSQKNNMWKYIILLELPKANLIVQIGLDFFGVKSKRVMRLFLGIIFRKDLKECQPHITTHTEPVKLIQ
jgi:hypothetical protein